MLGMPPKQGFAQGHQGFPQLGPSAAYGGGVPHTCERRFVFPSFQIPSASFSRASGGVPLDYARRNEGYCGPGFDRRELDRRRLLKKIAEESAQRTWIGSCRLRGVSGSGTGWR